MYQYNLDCNNKAKYKVQIAINQISANTAKSY